MKQFLKYSSQHILTFYFPFHIRFLDLFDILKYVLSFGWCNRFRMDDPNMGTTFKHNSFGSSLKSAFRISRFSPWVFGISDSLARPSKLVSSIKVTSSHKEGFAFFQFLECVFMFFEFAVAVLHQTLHRVCGPFFQCLHAATGEILIILCFLVFR